MLGYRQWARAQPRTPCKGKSSRRKSLSWQPRKRLQRRKRNTKRNTNRPRGVTSHRPKEIHESLPGEAPPVRLFRLVGGRPWLAIHKDRQVPVFFAFSKSRSALELCTTHDPANDKRPTGSDGSRARIGGCSATRIVLETAKAGILAFLRSGRHLSQAV